MELEPTPEIIDISERQMVLFPEEFKNVFIRLAEKYDGQLLLWRVLDQEDTEADEVISIGSIDYQDICQDGKIIMRCAYRNIEDLDFFSTTIGQLDINNMQGTLILEGKKIVVNNESPPTYMSELFLGNRKVVNWFAENRPKLGKIMLKN